MILALLTDSNRQEVINHFAEYGAWDDLDSWDNNRLNALLIQDISAELKETDSARISLGDDSEYYYYLGL